MAFPLILPFFVLGAVLASFAGVLAGRLYTGGSFVRGSSRCDACGKPLGPLSLVPILSYAASGGRALCCGARISWVAPVSELALGALFAASYLRLGFSPALFCFLLALTLLTALVLYDLAHQILPPILLWLFVACSAVAGFLAAPDAAAYSFALACAVVFAVFFAALHFFSGGRAMGLADSPFVAGLALLAGRTALSGFLFSFWFGAGVGILLLVRMPRGARMGIEVPFAPFLAAGFLFAYFTQWDPFAITSSLSNLIAGLPW